MIDGFKQKAREWFAKVEALRATRPSGELAQEKKTLIKWADRIKSSIETIFGTLDVATGSGLGVAPLIPAAAIATAIAAMAYWASDYAKFMAKYQEQLRLEGRGLSPKEASLIVTANAHRPGLLDTVKALAPVAIFGGAFLLFSRGK